LLSFFDKSECGLLLLHNFNSIAVLLVQSGDTARALLPLSVDIGYQSDQSHPCCTHFRCLLIGSIPFANFELVKTERSQEPHLLVVSLNLSEGEDWHTLEVDA